jgi:dTDP-4-dehydrorhamnose 3,5-epimerase
MIEVRPLELDGLVEIVPRRAGDERGFFSETYNAERFAEAGIATPFIQDNHSYSAARGVLRGLHYQLPPRAQHKLVRVVRGSILAAARRPSESGWRSNFRRLPGIRSSSRKASPTVS